MSRRCDECGEGYFRRNLTEVWDVRNPGKRMGWGKRISKLCCKCLTMKQVLRLLPMVGLSPPILRAAKRTRKVKP